MWSIKTQLGFLISLVTLHITVFILLHVDGSEKRRFNPVIYQGGQRYGHILTLNYTGQQGAGLRGLLSQQCWVKDFGLPMRIVSPFIKDSKLQHSMGIWSAHDTVSAFGDYYDNSHFNSESIKMGNPVLVPWKQFLDTGSRNLIVLSIQNVHSKLCLSYLKKEMCTRHNEPISSLFKTDCALRKGTKHALEYLETLGFVVQRKICLDCEHNIIMKATPKEIVKHIFGEHEPKDVTILVDQWKFSIQMSPECSTSCPKSGQILIQTIQPSRSLSYDTTSYTNSLYKKAFQDLQVSPELTVGIMVRVEWIMIAVSAHKLGEPAKVIQNCLKELLLMFNSLKGIKGQKHSIKLPILALDIGQFGSSTFQHSMKINNIDHNVYNDVVKVLKDFVGNVYHKKLTFEEWENTYTMFSNDSGYIAYMQNTLVGQSDCLLLMGGGHFQQMAIDHYHRTHQTDASCIHSFCTPDKLTA